MIGTATTSQPAHGGTSRAWLDGYGATHTDSVSQYGAGWQLSPYTNNGEAFYTLAASFTVTLDHPTGLLTPATGTSTEVPGAAGRTVTTATATKVRDFAWSAGPVNRSSTTSAAGTRVNTYWTGRVLHRLRHRPGPGPGRHRLLAPELAVGGGEGLQPDVVLGRALHPLGTGSPA